MKKKINDTQKFIVGNAKGAFTALNKSLRESTAAAPPELRRRAKQMLFLALVLFMAVSGFKYSYQKREERHRKTELAAGPRVRVAKVTKGIGEHRVKLIGETRPYESATLYAKVSGYLRDVKVDKGDIVTKGQLLAVIESPETDEGFLAAQADAKNKHSILARMQSLHEKKLISQQEFDQAQADADVASAHLRSQKTLKGYEILKAPFSGTVTARYADAGALVQNATSSETSALPVVMVSDIKRLRIDVFIDQRDAPFVQKDDPVVITLPERPGLKIDGHVNRLTGELDPRTKMLLTEIDIPNENNTLVAGSFVQISLLIKSPPYLEAPVEALILKEDKAFLTSVDPKGILTFRPIEIAANDGKTLSIISGADEGQLVALNVGNSLPEGSKVRPIIETLTSK